MTGAELRQQIEETLNGVVDPCSVAAGAPAGLVDMGLIRVVTSPGDGQIEADVYINVTDPLCMMSGVFLGEAQSRLAKLTGASVRVHLEQGRLWTPGDMTPGYQSRLSAARAARSKQETSV